MVSLDIVTTDDLRAMRSALLERLAEIGHERNMVKDRLQAVDKELRTRACQGGSTNDREAWRGLAIR
jgi:hypothetical protein